MAETTSDAANGDSRSRFGLLRRPGRKEVAAGERGRFKFLFCIKKTTRPVWIRGHMKVNRYFDINSSSSS
jgi:hypothetical protein